MHSQIHKCAVYSNIYMANSGTILRMLMKCGDIIGINRHSDTFKPMLPFGLKINFRQECLKIIMCTNLVNIDAIVFKLLYFFCNLVRQMISEAVIVLISLCSTVHFSEFKSEKLVPWGTDGRLPLSDLDLGSGHTAYRRASLIDLYLRTKFH